MKRYDLDYDGMKEDIEGTYVKHDDVSEYPYVDLHLWEEWAREVCRDFRIEYDDHPVGLRCAITKWMSNFLHNAGGMARELAAQDSESPTNVNG